MARHEGIRQLPSGKWQARIPITTDGVTRQVSVGTFDRLADAKDARSLALAQRKQRTYVEKSKGHVKVEQWLQQWVSLRRIKPTGRLRTASRHIIGRWGTRSIADLEPVDVQHWVNNMVDAGLKPASVHGYYGVFRQMMEAAVDLDLIYRSPCRAITLPKLARSLPYPLTVEQVLALEDALAVPHDVAKGAWKDTTPPRFDLMAHLAAWCGLRWGEVAALRWEHVDLGARMIVVQEAVKDGGKDIGLPKNGKSRAVPMSVATVERLSVLRRDRGGSGLLFPNRVGKIQSYGNFRKFAWSPAVQQVGCVDATFHDLRHFYATTAVAAGVDSKVLSDAMGHALPSFTMDRYGVARHDAAAVLAAAVEAAMKAAT